MEKGACFRIYTLEEGRSVVYIGGCCGRGLYRVYAKDFGGEDISDELGACVGHTR
jgi:hypothetical protein